MDCAVRTAMIENRILSLTGAAALLCFSLGTAGLIG
jgi:hypothetical protein